jgi:hypothetical protein
LLQRTVRTCFNSGGTSSVKGTKKREKLKKTKKKIAYCKLADILQWRQVALRNISLWFIWGEMNSKEEDLLSKQRLSCQLME